MIYIKRSIFKRILAACMVPQILIFFVVIVSINKIFYDVNSRYAEDMAVSFADECYRQVNEKFAELEKLLFIVDNAYREVVKVEPNSKEILEQLAVSVLQSTPGMSSIWYSFIPNTFTEGERYSKDFVRKGDEVVEIFDLTDELLSDPEESMWYYIPFTTGEISHSIGLYDYGIGTGMEYFGTVGYPIEREGTIIGVVGIDIRYEESFQFLDNRRIENGREIMLIADDGHILYSTKEGYSNKSLQELPFIDSQKILDSMKTGESFTDSGYSPVVDSNSIKYFLPVYSNVNGANETNVYIYVDLSDKILYSQTEAAMSAIGKTTIACMFLLAICIYITLRVFVKPETEN